jgi:hypothetical protein
MVVYVRIWHPGRFAFGKEASQDFFKSVSRSFTRLASPVEENGSPGTKSGVLTQNGKVVMFEVAGAWTFGVAFRDVDGFVWWALDDAKLLTLKTFGRWGKHLLYYAS